ncbi:MAG: putative DNA binding domain-containing protein [Nitrosomonas sp.]|nr:putative DNA binding domain-containing protein [Nitrosomonas sp.]MDP1949663.1 putative DNA binding domain-containing protein [Nitrosomonas sp.]
MIAELIRRQIRQGEGLGTEFKADVRNLETIARTVCAFLNTHGGTIFCGVDERGKLVGIEPVADDIQTIHAYLLEAITPKALFTVNKDQEDGKAILSIEVPEGKDRPYVLAGSVYVRQGSATRMADAATLRDMVQSKSVEAERWERRPSMAMEESDLDRDEVRRTAQQAKESGRFSFHDSDDDISVLQALAVYSSKGFTQAADVLFAKNPALRHPQTRVRVTRFASDKGGDAYLDDRQLHGPLVKVFEQAFDIVSQHVKWESKFQVGELRREDRPEYPFEALREGLVNAFAHRDYAGFSGGIAVGIYPNRIEIWNSGHFPEGMKPADLSRNHPSLPTNPDIAHVLYLHGLMERIGRGAQMIIRVCHDHGLPTPKWADRPTGVTLTIFGRTGQEAAPLIANPRQQALLAQMNTGDQIRPGEYHQRFAADVSDRQARRDLVELEDAGLFLRVGKGAGTLYRRTERTWEGENRT